MIDAALHASPEAALTLSPAGPGVVVRAANPAAEALLGRPAAGLVGRPPDWLVSPRLADSLAGGTEFLGEAAAGPVRVRAHAVPLPGGAGHVCYLRLLDPSAGGQARLLLSAVEHANDAVLVTEAEPFDAPGPRIVYVNPAFTRMTGYTAAEVVGLTPRVLQGPKTDRAALDFLKASLRAWQPCRVELVNYRKDGSEFVVELDIVPVADEQGFYTHWVSVQRDVTERRRAEAALRHAQKMDAVGQLAGGIAHDFNNLLTAIRGNLALVDVPETDPRRAYVATADAAAARAAELTAKLLGYARRQTLRREPVAAGAVLAEAAALLRPPAGSNVRVTVEDRSAGWVVVGDAGQLLQVVLNLGMNAREAMPRGGALALAADAGPGPGGRPEVRLSVTDTGVGMDAATRERIFEPFFTTKPPGPGTGVGLGLAVVHGTVAQHGGRVECHSKPGEGTRFDVHLPAEPAPAAGPAPEARPAAAAAAGQAVLFVDDEAMIRTLGEFTLKSAGYRPVLAEDGPSAVAAYKAGGVALVVLDLTMPGPSGQETLAEILALDPAARVILSSGYSSEQVEPGCGAVDFLPKPYRPADLLERVRKALGGGP